MAELLQGLFPTQVNVGEEVFQSQIRSSCARDLPWLQQLPEHNGIAVIVAGGPSLGDCEDELHRLAARGARFFALNNTAAWLMARGIIPTYHVLLDARESTVRFISYHPATTYLLASQCAPAVFDAVEDAVLWHPNIEGILEFVGDRECALIGGGTTVGLQAMSIAYTLGFRDLKLFGYDSSYRGEEGHAYKQPENDNEPVHEVLFANRRFTCARWMIVQTEEFKSVAQQLSDEGCVISVAGDGFLPETFREMCKTVLTAVYDLAVSPPTYDFMSFLSEAERARLLGGYTYLDIVFQPGPINGFRDDELPPSSAERESMLHRICVSACRLLPSARNVTVLKARQALSGDIFPSAWTVLTPVSHYGTQWLINALPCLRATPAARALRAKRRTRPYATITIRKAAYWPLRNSKEKEWDKVADWLHDHGIEPYFIQDTETTSSADSWDIDFRLALYEGAVMNLGTGGLIALLCCTSAPYLWFNPIVPEYLSSSTEFLRRCGVEVGDQYTSNGKIVWEPDTYDVIVKELSLFYDQYSQKLLTT